MLYLDTPVGTATVTYTASTSLPKWSGDANALRYIEAAFQTNHFTGFDGLPLTMKDVSYEELLRFCTKGESPLRISKD